MATPEEIDVGLRISALAIPGFECRIIDNDNSSIYAGLLFKVTHKLSYKAMDELEAKLLEYTGMTFMESTWSIPTREKYSDLIGYTSARPAKQSKCVGIKRNSRVIIVDDREANDKILDTIEQRITKNRTLIAQAISNAVQMSEPAAPEIIPPAPATSAPTPPPSNRFLKSARALRPDLFGKPSDPGDMSR